MMAAVFEKPRSAFRIVCIGTVIPGLLLLVDFLRTPSEIGNQFLFGFSKMRLAVAILFTLLVLTNIGAAIWFNISLRPRQITVENRMTTWLLAHSTPVYIGLCSLAAITGLLCLILIPPVIRTLAFLEPIGSQLSGLLFWLFLSSALLAVFFRIANRVHFTDNPIIFRVDRFLLLATIFLIVFFLYEHLLIWTGAANQSRYSYWNLLADEFLHGRLYLNNPPQTHDLTSYNGKWYVPMPPLPAILMMPLAALVGGSQVDTGDFSIVFSALNAVLVFLILEQLNVRKWIRLSQTGILILVVLFAFGNPHLWVGLRGRAWFVSQIVTVTFLALAIFATLKSWSPWWVGVCIGLAVMSRPNGLMTWPFVCAIALQLIQEQTGKVTFREMLGWSVSSIVPIGAAVVCLLLYNYARFENFFDFGYVTISGDPTIVENAQRYGIFSTHYILTNLKAMFFSLPSLQSGGPWPILPSTTGMSLFLVTPPLFYLFQRYERQWWILGAWTSVFLNFVLLVLYHNTGAHQFGYRYILDAIVPLIMLLAVALKDKIPWHFTVLLVFSIAFNIYGAYWFING